MKRLLMLVAVTIVLASQVGCNSGWPRWLCRGDNCGSYGGMYGSSYDSSPVVGGTLVAPSGTVNELPGPR